MNSKFFQYTGTLIFLFSAFYVVGIFDGGYTSQHASLNDDAVKPDIYMSNAKHYAREEQLVSRSLEHLDKAINAIKNIEEDIDINSDEVVADAVYRLELIYNQMLKDSSKTEEMNAAFEYALNALTLAELRISEKYAESNRPKMAKIALKYARMHLKSADQYSSLPNYEREKHLYYEIDSLIESEDISPVLITEKIDNIIEEMDALLQDERKAMR